MTNVQQSVEIDYNVYSTTSTNAGFVYNVDTTLSAPSVSLVYNVRAIVSQSEALSYNVLMTVVPNVLLNVVYNVLQTQSIPKSLVYNVLVPVSSPASTGLVYNVLATVNQAGEAIVYNVLNLYPLIIQNSVGIVYHVLVTPTTVPVDTAPIATDAVPPQIVVTSIAGG